MNWKNLHKIATKSVVKNKSRSLLTMLGIVIGVLSVIVMVAIGQGSQAKIESQIKSMGTNMIMVRGGSSRSRGVSGGIGSENRLTIRDVEALRERNNYLNKVSPYLSSNGQAIGSGNNWNTRILGVSPEYFDIRDWELKSGRMFTEKEINSRRRVAILGQTVAEELFGDKNPIGERIRFDNTPLEVIGMLTEKGEGVRGMDEDDCIIVPYSTVMYRFKASEGGRYIDMVYCGAETEDMMDKAEDKIETILRDEHRLSPADENDFRIMNQADLIEMATSTSQTLTLLLGAIASVSLLVGGIGIMNVMLVSVTERTREIGIRLSVGARETDVLIQFLIESIFLSVLGGLIGIFLAIGICLYLNNFTSLRAIIDLSIIIIAFLFSAAVGTFFGFYPAKKASQLNPINALRHE